MTRAVLFVGVLNITPDSFSDGGLYTSMEAAVEHAQALLETGATFVDVGAESTNPWAKPLSASQEIVRLRSILPKLAKKYGSDKLSLDTYHPETIAWAIEHGIRPIVNDVSGLHSSVMQHLVITHNLRVIISHLPSTATGSPVSAHSGSLVDDIDQVRDELLRMAQSLESNGLHHNNIILDPGIGFGKTMRLNWQLLEFPSCVPDYAVMVGYSRKRFLHTDPKQGKEVPAIMTLKANSSRSEKDREVYSTWLRARHAEALDRLTRAAQHNHHSVYSRVHEVPASRQ